MADFTNVVQIDPGAVRAPRAPNLPMPRVADIREGGNQVAGEQVMTPQVADNSAPLRDIANSLAKGSDEANTVAQLFAKQAGYQAVTRDDQGNLVVAKAPIVGDAAVAYHSAVKYTALAMGESEAKQGDLALAQKYQNDPDGYLQAASAFRKQKVDEFTRTVGPDVGVSLASTIDTTTAQSYKFLVNKQQAKIASDFDSATAAKIKSLDVDIESLAKSDPNSPDLKGLIDQRIAVTKQRVQNPVLNEPPEVAALDLKKFDLKLGSDRFVGGLNKIMDNPAGGIGVAQTVVNDELNNPNIPPAQRQLNYQAGQDAIKEKLQNLQRATVLADKAQKDRDNKFEDAVIGDSATGAPKITENDIKTAPNISPEAKMRMLAWQKREDMPEPMARVSQTNAIGLFQKMNLPDDDPNHLKDLGPVRAAYANGQLTRADEDWLEKRFREGSSPDGAKITARRKELSEAARPMLDKSTMMNIDGEGKLRAYNFERFVDDKVDEYRKAGKNPMDLFTPGKPDFIGKPEIVNSFNIPLDQQARNKVRNMGLTPSGGSPTAAPAQRQPGESPSDFLKRTGGGLP